MNGTQVVIAGHLCNVRPSEQYSAVVDTQIDGCDVTLCFTKEARPEVRQRIMKNLLDAYDQRMHGV